MNVLVKNIKIEFKTLKNGDSKDYYIDEKFLIDRAKMKRSNIIKTYNNRKEKGNIIKKDNIIYFNQEGFELLIRMSGKNFNKNTADLLLVEFVNKNKTRTKKDNKEIKGALVTNRPPVAINKLKINNEVFLLSQELVESVDCSPRDFMKTLDKKMFSDKKNYIVKRQKKRFKNVAMNKEGFLQICRELKLKEEQYEKVLKIYNKNKQEI